MSSFERHTANHRPRCDLVEVRFQIDKTKSVLQEVSEDVSGGSDRMADLSAKLEAIYDQLRNSNSV